MTVGLWIILVLSLILNSAIYAITLGMNACYISILCVIL